MRLASVLEKFSEYCNLRKNWLYFAISFLHVDNVKGKTSMNSSQNWKNLVHNVNLKLAMSLQAWLFVAQMTILWERAFFVNLNWLFLKQYLKVMLLKRLVNMSAKFLSQIRLSICPVFQKTQNLEVEPPLKLQR